VLQGSFVIHNAIDVQTIAGYAQITGDLRIDAAGLTSVSLPTLCSVGAGLIEDNAPDLVSLDLPALTSAGALHVNGAPLQSINLSKLGTIGGDLILSTTGPISVPVLTSAGNINIWTAPTLVAAPRLISVGDFDVYCSSTCGPTSVDELRSATGQVVLNGTKVSASKLTTVLDLEIGVGTEIDLPALTSVSRTFRYVSNAAATFSELASVGGTFTVITMTPSLTFPSLTTIGNDVTIQGTGSGQSFSFPMLTTLNGNLTAPTIDLTGTFSAPRLATANNGLIIRKVSSLDLSGLQSVGGPTCGGPTWTTAFDLDQAAIAALQLPALTSGCLLFGGRACVNGNPQLASIAAPNLHQGGVQFFNNPSLPKCRADALAAQIASPIPFNIAGFEHCPLASGPCP
jgi:hypothetical protein